MPPLSTHYLIEPPESFSFIGYLCGELCLFVGWFPDFLFTEVRFSSQDWEPALMARCDLRQDKRMTFLLLA